MGNIVNNQSLSIIGNQQVTAKLGAAVAQTVDGNLALAAYDLYEFNTNPSLKLKDRDHPERVTNPGADIFV